MRFILSTRRTLQGLLVAGCLLCSYVSQASVVVTGTRVIYDASQREVTIKLNNDGAMPALVQSWIDDGDAQAGPDVATAPFILTPPIARIDSKKGQTLRVRYTGQKLSQDKESLFWLNVLEVPPSASDGQNKLKIAFRSRLKLFYRPANLPGDAVSAAGSVQWRAERSGNGWVLDCSNPSAYYVTLNQVKVAGIELKIGIDNSLVAPGQHLRLPLSASEPPSGNVSYSTINDFGSVNQHEQPLKR